MPIQVIAAAGATAFSIALSAARARQQRGSISVNEEPTAVVSNDTGDGIEVYSLNKLRELYRPPEKRAKYEYKTSDMMTDLILETLHVTGTELTDLRRIAPERLDQSSPLRALGLTFTAVNEAHVALVTNNYDPKRLEQIRNKVGHGHFAVMRGASHIVVVAPRAMYLALMARWFNKLSIVDEELAKAEPGVALLTYAYRARNNNPLGQYRRGRGIFCGYAGEGYVYVLSKRTCFDFATVDLSACSRIPVSNILHVRQRAPSE